MKGRHLKVKNYDYEFYFLIVIIFLGILLYLQIKSIFFSENQPEVEKKKVMTVAEEMVLMSIPSVETKELPEISETTDQNSSYIIDGIDFSGYNAGEEGLQELMAKMQYDSLRILVTTFYSGAIDVLADENLYTMQKGRGYIYYIVFPKDPAEVNAGDSVTLEHIESYGAYDIYSFTMNNIVGENIKVPIDVIYTDGTEETVTIYITKEFDD